MLKTEVINAIQWVIVMVGSVAIIGTGVTIGGYAIGLLLGG